MTDSDLSVASGPQPAAAGPEVPASSGSSKEEGQGLFRADIRATPLPALSWAPADCEESLRVVYDHVRGDAQDAIRWYQEARRPKRRLAVAARFLAVLLLGAAGILPLLDQVLSIPSIWVSILVAAGVGVLAFDRFHGGSSGWIRYIRSDGQLRDALESFELEWEAERARWRGREPTIDQVEALLKRARNFAAAVNQVVREETQAWVEEFQRSIKQIDQALKARAEQAEAAHAAARPGAVNLTVTNGDRCEGGWTVEVELDNGTITERASGRSIAIGGVAPGIRPVKVAGTINGRQHAAEAAVNVLPGTIVDHELTLT